ncbi:hypothetical protein MMC28_008603 [Mycoblastus sanguinarius]|nr:hypothetical protein [Mycoblastus sanguinarius]
MPDLTRYAHDPRGITIAQAISLPVFMTLIYFLGVVMAASSQVVYGQIQWNPLEIVLIWDNRAAKFFVGLLFAFAMIGTSIPRRNTIPFGNDMMALFPKYMSLRRGQLLCAVLGFAICPWKIEASASRFLGFLNGYSAPFLGPVSGVLLCDYFLVRRKVGYNVYQMYKPHGLYWYLAGVNSRAVLAFIVGMVPQLPGLVHQINAETKGISAGYVNFSSLGWVEGLVFSGLAYYLLFVVSPFPTQTDEEDQSAWAIHRRGQLEEVTASMSSRHDSEKAARSTTNVLSAM